MEQEWAYGHDITAVQIMPGAIYNMSRALVEKDTHFVKLMEMLEFHIDGIWTFIIVKKIKECLVG